MDQQESSGAADLSDTGTGEGSGKRALPDAGRTVEFRIHGIGNHSPWSALGNPRVAQPPGPLPDDASSTATPSDKPLRLKPNRFVESFSPPPVADEVWLLNWARTSRRTARLAWFLAIPFTMVNVAGHMVPAETEGRVRAGRLTVTTAVYATSILLSISAFMWITAIVETGLKHLGGADLYLFVLRVVVTFAVVVVAGRVKAPQLIARFLVRLLTVTVVLWLWFTVLAPRVVADLGLRWRVDQWEGVYRWTIGAVGVGLGIFVLARAFTRPQSAGPRAWAWVHAAIFAASGVLVGVYRPAQWDAPAWLPTWATVPRPAYELCTAPSLERSSPICSDRVDVMTLVIVATTTLAVLLGIVSLAAPHPHSPSGGPRPNVAGAALLITLAVVVVHTMGSIARVGLDWIMVYVDRMTTYVDVQPGWPNPVPFRVLTPYDSNNEFIYRIDLVVPGALLLGLSLLAGFMVALLVRSEDLTIAATADVRVSFGHRVVQSLPRTLPVVVGVALPTFAATTSGLGWYLNGSFALPGAVRFAIALVVQMTALLFVLLFSGRLAKARDVLERFADVAGFWRVRYHPLSGASYRPHVLRGLVHEIARSSADTIVVVGHSQGSVLAACIVGEHFEADSACRAEKGVNGKTWRLLTCGSPLSSLYGAFFPAHIDDTFFARIGAQDRWTNCWRTTDPIASSIPHAHNKPLPDPRPPELVPRGHGDYWTDEDQLVLVRRLRTESNTPQVPFR